MIWNKVTSNTNTVLKKKLNTIQYNLTPLWQDFLFVKKATTKKDNWNNHNIKVCCKSYDLRLKGCPLYLERFLECCTWTPSEWWTDILILAANWEIPRLLRYTPSGLNKLAFGSPLIIIFEWSLVRVPIEVLSNKHI